ncbi:hypothetical protein EMMF5_006555 [Cystobasidiomycetes sp. EMM_F5]
MQAFASDTFQARKVLLLVPCAISVIGCAIAPGASSIYRIIVAQMLIGFGFACVPLAYSIPSEVLPRRWRPLAQSVMNAAASLGAIIGPLTAGALVRNFGLGGWRKFYWVQMGFWGITLIAIAIGYKPPKRHTKLDGLSLWQKLGRLDLPGMFLLTAGLTLLLVGLSLGGNPWVWSDARVVATLVTGFGLLVCYGLYEWKVTHTGMLHHDLFSGGRTFPICIGLIFIEAILLFPYVVFYPVQTAALFEEDAFLVTARGTPFWIAGFLATLFYGYWSSKRRTIRSPLFAAFICLLAGVVGMTTIQPQDSTRAIVFDGLSGIGYAGALVLVVTGVQLSTPHHLIATATAVVTSSPAVAASAFTAVYGAALTNQLNVKLPEYVASAAVAAGLPPSSLPAFVPAFLGKQSTNNIPGASIQVLLASASGLLQALADSFRIVYIIAVPFGVVALVLCFFIGDTAATMHYGVDAPLEDLHRHGHSTGSWNPNSNDNDVKGV